LLYSRNVIRSFRSKALRNFWQKGKAGAVNPEWVRRIRLILSTMDAAESPTELDLPGLAFHALKGVRKGRFALTVSGNWRITFKWQGPDAVEVELEDYHGK